MASLIATIIVSYMWIKAFIEKIGRIKPIHPNLSQECWRYVAKLKVL